MPRAPATRRPRCPRAAGAASRQRALPSLRWGPADATRRLHQHAASSVRQLPDGPSLPRAQPCRAPAASPEAAPTPSAPASGPVTVASRPLPPVPLPRLPSPPAAPALPPFPCLPPPPLPPRCCCCCCCCCPPAESLRSPLPRSCPSQLPAPCGNAAPSPGAACAADAAGCGSNAWLVPRFCRPEEGCGERPAACFARRTPVVPVPVLAAGSGSWEAVACCCSGGWFSWPAFGWTTSGRGGVEARSCGRSKRRLRPPATPKGGQRATGSP